MFAFGLCPIYFPLPRWVSFPVNFVLKIGFACFVLPAPVKDGFDFPFLFPLFGNYRWGLRWIPAVWIWMEFSEETDVENIMYAHCMGEFKFKGVTSDFF